MNTQKFRLTAALVLGFLALTYLLAWSSVFSVKAISVTGLPQQISEKSITAKSQVVVGDQLARIEPRAIEHSLQEISWIKNVSVSRNWLNGSVTIDISSRIPVGIFQGRALDSDGVLFDLPGNPPAGLPVVSARSPELGLVAIDLFTHLPQDLRSSLLSISAAHASAISSWQKFEDRKIKIQWGSAQDISLKVSVYRALMALPENKNVKRIDLSAPHAPIVK